MLLYFQFAIFMSTRDFQKKMFLLIHSHAPELRIENWVRRSSTF